MASSTQYRAARVTSTASAGADPIRRPTATERRGGPVVDHQVDVDGASRIPAGVDGVELDHACRVGRLANAQERLVGEVLAAWGGVGGDDGGVVRWREARVAAKRVAVPDLDRCVAHGGASTDRESDAESQWCAVAVFNDVASQRLCVAMEGPSSCSAHDRHVVQVVSIDASERVTAFMS